MEALMDMDQTNENGTTDRIFEFQYADTKTKSDATADTLCTISVEAIFISEEVGGAIPRHLLSFEKITLARVLPKASSVREIIKIEEPPEGAISIKGNLVEIDSKRLSRDTYYPVLYRGEKHFIQVSDESLMLCESFELRDGRLLLNKLFEVKSG